MKTAIVTGAGGFIGRTLTKLLLEKGVEVWAVVRNQEAMADLSGEGLTVVQAEMGEYAKLGERIGERGFDAFFHLAWDGTFGDSFRDYHRQMKNAAYAGDALLAAAALDAKRFILAETIVVLEAKHYMMRDGGQPRVSCIYGTAKAAADMVCRTLAYQNGMTFNGAVLASVYGWGDRSKMIQNVLIRALQQGECPKLVSGENLYDWIYVDDAARALIAIAESGKPDKTYYVGHRELQTFEYLVSHTRDVVAPEVPLTFGTLMERTVTDYSLIDREALYRDTGFECRADFEESIQRTARWLSREDARMNENTAKRTKNLTGGGTV